MIFSIAFKEFMLQQMIVSHSDMMALVLNARDVSFLGPSPPPATRHQKLSLQWQRQRLAKLQQLWVLSRCRRELSFVRRESKEGLFFVGLKTED